MNFLKGKVRKSHGQSLLKKKQICSVFSTLMHSRRFGSCSTVDSYFRRLFEYNEYCAKIFFVFLFVNFTFLGLKKFRVN